MAQRRGASRKPGSKEPGKAGRQVIAAFFVTNDEFILLIAMRFCLG